MYQSGTDDSYRYQEVERRIQGMIESGDLEPGHRLPSLRQISTTHGVSISTATHAYLELERKGLVEARPRSGYYVRQGFRHLPTPERQQVEQDEPRAVNKARLIQNVLGTMGDQKLLPLGLVCPSHDALPIKALGRIMGQIVRSEGQSWVDYTPVAGAPELKRQIAFRSMDTGKPYAAEDTVITNGCMEALYIALRCLTRPGDTVLIQSPTYFCFLQLLESLGLRAIEVPSCPVNGVDPADVADAVDTYGISACILSPNFNNPDGSLTPEAAKAEIVRLLAERGVPLVEDDVYGDVYFDDRRPPTMKSMDEQGLVILCSSFSKTVSPGLRLGWMVPGRWLDKALSIKATTSVASASPNQLAMAEYLGGGQYDRHLRRFRTAMDRDMAAMQNHLVQAFPEGTRCTRPRGGSVIWLELPGSVDSVELFYRARQNGIGIAPGSIFTTREKYDNFIRLTCSGVWDDNVRRGLDTLGRLTDECR